jgi:thiol-disulfide isomerase/thioredoxin
MRFTRIAAGLVIVILGALPARAGDDNRTPGARLAEIEAAQKAVFEQFSAELQKVEQTEKAQAPLVERFHRSLRRNVEAAFDLARAYPSDPAAFEALKFVIMRNRAGPGDGSARALRMILERGDFRAAGQGNYLATVALTLRQYPDAEKVLRGVLDENPIRSERADACYWLAQYRFQQARLVRKLRAAPDEIKDYEKYTAAQPISEYLKEHDPDALEMESETLLERVVAEFGDVRTGDDPRTLGTVASGELFSRRNLQVGKTAPDIDGTDHEGNGLKLSDYRGKVVVLTFSGNWCGPCRGMYPQERKLVAELRDKPFALVSVDTDKDVATLRKSITAGEVTWRSWWDGGTDGPITTRWGVVSFPSIFVLDSAGVIRFKDVRGDDLDRAVATLLKERAAEKSGAKQTK